MSRIRKLLLTAAAAAAAPAAAQTPPANCPPVPDCGPAILRFGGAAPGAPSAVPPGGPQTTPSPDPQAAPPAVDPDALFGSGRAGAGAGDSVALAAGPVGGGGGYIDNAVPVTMFRLRYDAAYGNNRPDRAEFFYAKCGCFRNPANFPNAQTPGVPGPGFDPTARGPGSSPETNVDYQELTPYFEFAANPRLSFFASIPVRFLNPTVDPNTAGLSDVSFGFKYALILCQDRVLTAQVRVITPTGSPTQGLGTSNWWIEPGLLFLRQPTSRWAVFGEVRDQIPIAPASDFAGNVLRYGLGTSYVVCQWDGGYVAPVVETVGWTVLSGKEFSPDGGVQQAAGDTIVNAKFGLRIGLGQPTVPGLNSTRSDIYIGYGRALTGEVWYKDMLRLEYRRFF